MAAHAGLIWSASGVCQMLGGWRIRIAKAGTWRPSIVLGNRSYS